ncbi:transporter suffix domain-containing protein [Mesorhizobium sp. B1-1-8]|uniref:transporter suffix domain-containing protein n=1 Tax=Mesorhizobium sp. B1-1-8 TaxID=2589976 RepID=UPI00112766EF|nr:transporter suffix domain-containing protein [Mesorhizobium sp. B1-1-8]UCI05648.1 transporter suffix domain-containing protein [Mesorhizobium sp. B1-1-8]
MTYQEQLATDPDSRGWRFKCGVALFGLLIFLALMIPVTAFSGMEAGKIAAITGAIFVFNKVLMVLIVAVMGKAGFQELKQSLGAYLPKLPADEIVSPLRHYIGLLMFCVPIITGWLAPYLDHLWPGLRPDRIEFRAFGDIMMVVSIFVLGGGFWDKVRALFVRTARVSYAATGGANL